MAVLRYIVPALAVASRVAAQSSCSVAATTTIQSQADATALSNCQTFTGSIAIAAETTDNIALDGISTITGDLIANNATAITELSADSLQQIGGSFTLESMTVLSTLSFPQLTKVNSIMWTALPALQGLSFTTGVQEVMSMTIQNTQLNSLSGIDLQVAKVITVTENYYLNDINMQLGNITQSLTLSYNGHQLNAQFPNLMWAYNMTFYSCSQLSIPSLASINGSLGFFQSDFSSLSAPNLTNVGGSLVFNSNPDLSNVSMPELTAVGAALNFQNNTDLQNVSLPALKSVGGAVYFTGAFNNVSLPSIQDVKGAFNVTSTGNVSSSCAIFKPLSGQNNVIKGTYHCNGTQDGSTSTSSGSGSGSSSASPSSTSKSSANGIVIPAATGILGVVAAIFGLL